MSLTGTKFAGHSTIALVQAAVGSNVAINYFNTSEAAEKLCQRILQTGGYAHAFKADVRSEAEIVRLVREVRDPPVESTFWW
jgi:3-oxoacyl-[acyl-carrier protein] reductase